LRYVLAACFLIGFCSDGRAQALSQEQRPYPDIAAQITQRGLTDQDAYAMLKELTGKIGARLSGSPQAAAAVQWGKRTLESKGFANVHLEKVMVPHWVRGKRERALLISPEDGHKVPLSILALGGSPGTPTGGITAEVIEVHSLDEVKQLGDKVKGKIVFYNRPMNPAFPNTFEAYGDAGDQRFSGPAVAAKAGAAAVLVRSMTLALDDVPHTGATIVAKDGPNVPSAAVSTIGANLLSGKLKQNPNIRVRLILNCQTLPDVESANVVGEIVGSELPGEVIVVGGHLDSWDVGQGAHDDGAGVVQSIEAVSLMKRLGLRPKRTVRVVLFMNEENGGRGAVGYASASRPGEKCIVGMESDSGGFAPRGFGVDGKPEAVSNIARWAYLLEAIGADKIGPGGADADVGPLQAKGAVAIGLIPESQRYFDYHHTNSDTIDKVNPRELELGAISMSILLYVIAQEGV
jgi:carboxypeptidase Q